MVLKIANEKMVLISVHVSKHMLDEIDELVKLGIYPSRSEAIRVAIRDLVLREREFKNSQDRSLMSGK